MNLGHRSTTLLPTFFVFYVKMIKNFVLYHLSNVLIFSVLILGITFVFFKTLSEELNKEVNQELMVFAIIFGITIVAVGYVFPYLAFDKSFLRENLSKRSHYFLRGIQHYTVSLLVLTALSVPPLITGQLTFQCFILIPLAMSVVSLASPILFLRKSQQKTKSKYLSHIFENQLGFLSKKILAIVGLNSLYFIRRNRRDLFAGGCYIVLMNICIIGYLINNGELDQTGLFIIPFMASLFFAVNKNVAVYCELESYTFSHKKNGFMSDYLFWIALLFIQWLLTVVALLMVGLKVLPMFLFILAAMPILVFYCLVLKFKYLENRILRSLSLAFSIVFPLIIPLFLFLFFVEIKND